MVGGKEGAALSPAPRHTGKGTGGRGRGPARPLGAGLRAPSRVRGRYDECDSQLVVS